MVTAIDSALSGFAAASQRLNVSARNIASADSTQTLENSTSVNTPYVPEQLAQSSQATGGVATSLQPVNPPSIEVYDPGNPATNGNGITQYPNADQAQQLVQANIASYDAQGNLAVIKVENHLLQSVINIVS